MYIHLEDWNPRDIYGYHINELITVKAFATEVDPRTVLQGFDDLFVTEASADEFREGESFKYAGRGIYDHESLEIALAALELSDFGNRTTRALFRFGNSGRDSVLQAAMHEEVPVQGLKRPLDKEEAKEEKLDWAVDHPLLVIQGIVAAQEDPAMANKLHLDIPPQQLSHTSLRDRVDFSNSKEVLDMHQGNRLRRSLPSS